MTRRILVVEDEPLIRLDAVLMRKLAVRSVVEFDRADVVLEFAHAHPTGVSAVFTDINLRGEMDGIELAREIDQADPSTALVVTSGQLQGRPVTLPDSAAFLRKPWLEVA